MVDRAGPREISVLQCTPSDESHQRGRLTPSRWCWQSHFGIAGAAIAALIAEAAGLLLGLLIVRHLSKRQFLASLASPFDRAKFMLMLAVNPLITIRIVSPIVMFLFFTAQVSCAGDVTLAANAKLQHLFCCSAPSSSMALANAARADLRLCAGSGAATRRPSQAPRNLSSCWASVSRSRWLYASWRSGSTASLDTMTASVEVRRIALNDPPFADFCAAARCIRFCLRRDPHRCDLGARHAQSDDGLAGDPH